MSLNQLLFIPDPKDERGFKQFLFWHAQEHLRIRTAVQQQTGVNLPIYVLDPVNLSSKDRYLQDHQSAHNDFNGLFGLQSNDLSSVDFNDKLQREAWAFFDYLEHKSVCSVLGIG